MIGVLAVGMFLGAALACTVYMSCAKAEDGWYYSCWVICQPGSEVLIREKPGKRAEVVGAAAGGSRMRTDWREKNGWLHLVDVNNETGEGWISERYIVFTEPEKVDGEMVITGKGRVACRKWIDGKRSGWIQPGQTVTVYWKSDEWAVTSRGFIKSEYLGGAGE